MLRGILLAGAGAAAIALGGVAGAPGALAQNVTTQCIANIAAQGTSDAITSAQLPCGTTTTLALLTIAAANVTTTPTYAPVGSPALVITKGAGAALVAGDLQPGLVALLTSTGSKWVLLNPYNGSPLAPGLNGEVLYSNAGAFGGFSVNGDGVLNTSTGALTVTKTGGVAFGALATQSSVNLSTQATGTLQAAQEPAHAGDVTNVAGSLTLTLPTVNSNVGSFGGAASVPNVTVNAKGLVTAAGASPVAAPLSGITGLGTGVATALGNTTNGNGGIVVDVAAPNDGVTDASTAINAAIAAAASGTVLRLPQGTIYIHSSITFAALKNGLRLTGAGPAATTITSDQNIPMTVVGSYVYGGTNTWSYSTSPIYYTEVDNISFTNTAATKTNVVGVHLQGALYGSVQDITCTTMPECLEISPISEWNHIERIRSIGTGLTDTILVDATGYTSTYNSSGNVYKDIMGVGMTRSIVTMTGCTFGDFTIDGVNGTGVASGGSGAGGGAIAAVYLNRTGNCGDAATTYGSHWGISNVKMDGVSDYVVKMIGVDHGSISNLADGGNVTNLINADSGSSVMAYGALTTQYTIATLPACNAGTKGLKTIVTNGQTTPTFLGTVSTTGAVIAPVVCNGTAWLYGG